MRPFILFALLLTLANCEPQSQHSGNQRPLVYGNWPPKSAKQLSRPAAGGLGGASGKQRTLVVQIRSDQPVPLVLKGRPGHPHSHATHQHLAHAHAIHPHVLQHPHSHAHLHSHPHVLHVPQHQHQHQHLRGPRPIKLSAPVYLKPASAMRKPLKIKLNNSKPKAKPTFGYEKPFKFEKPTAVSYSELQTLPLDTHNNFNTEHFAPIYTVPAPNLAVHDNHLELDDGGHFATSYLPPQHTSQSPPPSARPQTYLAPGYNVHEEETNDQTIRDPISGSQKLFAPDPDPSLPTSKIRPATETFNTPSNSKPLPSDVQSNHLPAQPLVQIVGAQAAAQSAPEIYPVQYAQQTQQLQPFLAASISAAHIPIYNPTYLVTQSNQLYTQHKQQLFKPSAEHVLEAGYVNADLTQEVASNGQILQAAKDPHHNIHPVLDSAPQYAALIAAPALGEPVESAYETASFHLPNVAAAVTSTAPEGGFVVSNYYGHPHDSSQLLQAYAEEEARRQQLETEHAALELQKQQQYHLDELNAQALEQQQQQQFHLEELRAHAQRQQEQQQQQQQHLEELRAQAQAQQQQNQHLEELRAQAHAQHQQNQHLEDLRAQAHAQHQQQLQFEELKAQAEEQHLQNQQQQQQLQLVQLQQQHQQLQQPVQHHPQPAQDPAATAFEEHQRLVQQQLGSNTPLRIFVPDEEAASESRLQKRSDDLKKGTVEDVHNLGSTDSEAESAKDLFEVSTSVEVAGEHHIAGST
ncbi:bromodomain-containing protein DDB_G0280777 [Drosophila subobscura]|uniref:bromodomain-containing protein DDB_G0280777 n=1 Tax=Drosophila subobscura TaxID=7241 RepID=UPI00155A1B6B|nr:bromodomain-containing protein DDB_G0280777 [Drosophila subobscura]